MVLGEKHGTNYLPYTIEPEYLDKYQAAFSGHIIFQLLS